MQNMLVTWLCEFRRKLDELAAPKKGRKKGGGSGASTSTVLKPPAVAAVTGGQATVLAAAPTGWAKIPKVCTAAIFFRQTECSA